MRRHCLSLLASASLVLGGCQAVVRDFRHPGGYPGYLLDQRTFDAAHSKQLQLLRATIIMAMAARMAHVTANSPDDADAVANYLGATADEINFTAANIFDSNIGGILAPPCAIFETSAPAKPQDYAVQLADAVSQARGYAADARQAAEQSKAAYNALANGKGQLSVAPIPTPAVHSGACPGYYVNFEADVPLVENRLARLMFATLPQEQIKDFASDVAKGNILGGAWKAIKILVVGARGLHQAAGTYRSGQEALAVNFTKNDCAKEWDRDETKMTVENAVACLGLEPDQFFGIHPNERKGDQMPHTVSVRTFEAVMAIARTSCVSLPLGTADARAKSLYDSRKARYEACGKLYFKPTPRPDRVSWTEQEAIPAD